MCREIVLFTVLSLTCWGGFVHSTALVQEKESDFQGSRDLGTLFSSLFSSNRNELIGSSGCTYLPNDFNSVLILDVYGTPETLTSNEITQMEDAFLNSYNGLVDTLCDFEFRRASQIQIESSELEINSRRNLQDAFDNEVLARTNASFKTNRKSTQNQGKWPARRFSLKVVVLGNCRGCEKDAALYDDAFRRRLERGNSRIGSALDRRPVDLPGDGTKLLWSRNRRNCDCVTTGDLPDRAPGLDEFNAEYSSNISNLVAAGSLTSITKVYGVIQVSPVECEGLLDEFKSEIVVDATGDPEKITEQELNVMKDLFISSYRTTSENVCDPKFRLVTDAEVSVESPRRDLMAYDSPRQLKPSAPPAISPNSRFKPFRFRFKVSGKCKGCKTDQRLFDDAFRRLMEVTKFTMHRDLAFITNQGQCYCVEESPERSPSKEEFGQELSTSVEQQSSTMLPNVVQIGTVYQPGDLVPTSSPTKTPTISPTRSPTRSPTTLPPSASPTRTPSSQPPSEQPSEAPTRPTVPTESPMPSPQPSLVPSNE